MSSVEGIKPSALRLIAQRFAAELSLSARCTIFTTLDLMSNFQFVNLALKKILFLRTLSNTSCKMLNV